MLDGSGQSLFTFVRPLGTGQTLAVLGNPAAAAAAGFVDGKVYKGRVRVLSKDDRDWMFVMKKDGVVAPVPSTCGNVPRPCAHCKAGLKKDKDVCYRVFEWSTSGRKLASS